VPSVASPLLPRSNARGTQPTVERYRKGTVDNFWAEFSANGKHMAFSHIITILRSQRKAENVAIVHLAHDQYGARFEELFSYLKNGKTVVMSSSVDIVRWYRELQASGV
jgi:hypothetical protein